MDTDFAVSAPAPNALAQARSAYLRSAMHQPVQWEEWGPAAFARAVREDKPILLDIGAVWCHWCHVMDRESYENERTAGLINEHFVAIKVDRDERPDVDTRYQSAVAAISGQGGWPLTAFLTPEGQPFFGGTYFPPEDRHGRPSLQRVLLTMAEAFAQRRHEVNESAASVMEAIEHNETFSGRGGSLGPALVQTMVRQTLEQFDPRSGGFGSQPKFPHSSALDLLLDAAGRGAEGSPEIAEEAARAAGFTLEQMLRGGIYDQLAGGFHRYSVDERWIVPHFEKMLYDNSALLLNYIHGFRALGVPEFARTAREIVRWVNETLSDQKRGGFYASQDADVSLDDDGDYFTWTRDEVAAVLDGEALALTLAYFDVGEVGDMHHNPAKNVLRVAETLDDAAAEAGLESARAEAVLAEAKGQLLAARRQRPTPFVDRTLYTAWNGMCISAYLEAGQVLGDEGVVQFGTRSLDRALAAALTPEGDVRHVIGYGDDAAESGAAATVPGVLDDAVFLGMAALDAWQATGEARYLASAERIAARVVERFHDAEGGGFFDTAKSEGEPALGVLGARRKPLQDSPTPAGNAVAAMLLLRLHALTDRTEWLVVAQETLESFAGVVEHFGLYAASYALALEQLAQPPVQICVIGEGDEARAMAREALAGYGVNRSVIRLRPDQLSELPAALAGTVPHLPMEQGGAVALVCSGGTCQPPARSTEELRAAMERLGLR